MSNHGLPVCSAPARGDAGTVLLAHGEGGRLMRELLASDILPPLTNEFLVAQGDAAVLPGLNAPPVFSTDSFVVSPLFFPGGNIGSLAIHGTCNDLAVAGARPLWVSLSLIIEEGFSRARLRQILSSTAEAARENGVQVVTGDTKVVPRGAADGLFINTAGLGELVFQTPGPASLAVGDELIVTGPIGQHGLAVLAARENLEFDPPLRTDCGPLFPAVEALWNAGVPVTAMRDATRGGVAAVMHEWAAACGQTLAIEGQSLPVTAGVRGACELLGLDPLHMACEGTMVVAVPTSNVERATKALQSSAVARRAKRIGSVVPKQIAPVVVSRALRRFVPLDEPLGALAPRIC